MKRVSTHGVVEVAGVEDMAALLAAAVVNGGLTRGKKRAQQFLHQFDRAAQKNMVLPRPLAHPSQQLVVFIHQSPQERTVIRRQQRNQIGELRVAGLVQALGDDGAAILAARAGLRETYAETEV